MTQPLNIVEAAWSGDIVGIKEALDAGADILAVDKEGWSALHVASRRGHIEMVKMLLNLGADVGLGGGDGWLPIHHAADNGNGKIMDLLIKAGSDIEARNKDGETPLIRACAQGHVGAAGALIKAGANLQSKSHNGNNALEAAIFAGKYKIALILYDFLKVSPYERINGATLLQHFSRDPDALKAIKSAQRSWQMEKFLNSVATKIDELARKVWLHKKIRARERVQRFMRELRAEKRRVVLNNGRAVASTNANKGMTAHIVDLVMMIEQLLTKSPKK